MGQIDISYFLKANLIGSNFLVDDWFVHNSDIEECELIILNIGNHFVVCFNKNGNWYKIDSLESPQNLFVKIEQNPLTILHTSRTFLKKSINLNFT